MNETDNLVRFFRIKSPPGQDLSQGNGKPKIKPTAALRAVSEKMLSANLPSITMFRSQHALELFGQLMCIVARNPAANFKSGTFPLSCPGFFQLVKHQVAGGPASALLTKQFFLLLTRA